jgi:hypothetical protein
METMENIKTYFFCHKFIKIKGDLMSKHTIQTKLIKIIALKRCRNKITESVICLEKQREKLLEKINLLEKELEKDLENE